MTEPSTHDGDVCKPEREPIVFFDEVALTSALAQYDRSSVYVSVNRFGVEEVFPLGDAANALEMSHPMRCTRCSHVHDTAKVEVVQRYSDCSTWRCPNCNALIDDRPVSWGGSAVPISVEPRRFHLR